MTDQARLNKIRDIFAESCVELFRSLECDIAHCALVDDMIEGAPTAEIDAGSEDIELNLIMRLPHEVLALTYPIIEEDINKLPEEKLDDWLSEISNLLMGRIKAKFMLHQCLILIGLPIGFFGDELDLHKVKDGYERFIFPFELDYQLCECILDIRVFNEDMTFAIEIEEDDSGVAEGEMELF